MSYKPRYAKSLAFFINNKIVSAAEEFARALKNHSRTVVLGEPFAGAAYVNIYFLRNDHFIWSVSTFTPFKPGTHLTWDSIGVQEKVLEVIKANIKK